MATAPLPGRLSRLAAICALVPMLSGGALIEWDGGGDGSSWGDPLNWVGDALPGAADTVSIGALAPGAGVIVGVSATVSGVECEAPMVLAPGGELVLSGASTFTALLHADGGTLTANGTLVADDIEIDSGSVALNNAVTAAGLEIRGGTATLGAPGWDNCTSRIQSLTLAGGTLRNTSGSSHEVRAAAFSMTGGSLDDGWLAVDGPGAWTGGAITGGAEILPQTDAFVISGPDPKELSGSQVRSSRAPVIVRCHLSLTNAAAIITPAMYPGAGLYLEGNVTLVAGAGGGSIDGNYGNGMHLSVDGSAVLDPSLGIGPNLEVVQLRPNAVLTMTPTADLLSGGELRRTWWLEDGAEVRFPAGATVTTNRGHVRLAGSASFPALATLHTNGANLELLDGQRLVTAGDLLNSGYLVLGGGADLRLGPGGAGTLTIAAGTALDLYPPSTIHGNVVNEGVLVPNADLRAVTLPAPAAIWGDYTQTASATLHVLERKRDGAIESLPLEVRGHATLAGTLNVVWSNPYPAPEAGDVVPAIRYQTFAGTLTPAPTLASRLPSMVLGSTEGWIRFGQPILRVDAEPDAGVSIDLDPAPATGGTPGVTPFERTYDWSTVITLTAPAVAEDRPFLRWEDGRGGGLGNGRALTVTLDGSLEVVAVYDPDPLLPGDPDGPFVLAYRDQTGFNLRRIWDLTGHYTGAAGPYAMTLDLTHGEKGTLTGTGRLQGTVGGQAFDLAGMVVKGSAKGKAGVVSVKGGLAGSSGSTAVSLKLNLTLDPEALTLNGTVTGKIADTVGGNAAVNSAVILPLPVGMDGTYQLPIDLLLDAKGAITGTGTLTLANGRAVTLLVKGKRAGGMTALQFAGDKVADPAFAAVKLKLLITTYSNGTAHIEAISGKALGQSLKWP